MATGLLGSVQNLTQPVTPQTPIVQATPANVASAAPPAPAVARTVTTPETVSGQLNTLLSADSAYLQSARNRGMETANSRGLINSTLAAGTSERAAIDAALPIAQQDATTNATAGQSAQQANQDRSLTGYKSLLDSAQQKENFGYTTAENDQNIKANTELQNARLQSSAALQTQAEGAAFKQQTQQQQATSTLQTALKQMDVNVDMSRLDATARDALTNATSPIIQQVQSEISQIQRTPDSTMSPEAKATAIAAQNDLLRTNLQTISTLYGYKLSWPTDGATQAATYAPQPAAPAAPTAPYTYGQIPNYEYPIGLADH